MQKTINWLISSYNYCLKTKFFQVKSLKLILIFLKTLFQIIYQFKVKKSFYSKKFGLVD